MSRNFSDWLQAYVDYASFSEAPRRMHFWTGVSALAGALRRRVWLDMAYFRWYANFYIILVAPPGIIAKSTTADIAMNLLRKVPEIIFGPEVVTWQALVTAFADSSKSFLYNNEYHPMCAMTMCSSEFGNLLNPSDRDMVDLLVTLWDSRQGGFSKITKMSGNDMVENPWINLVACTTPAWIAGHFPDYLIGGGFTSRCIFVYGEKKEKFVAYPFLEVPDNLKDTALKLIADLEHISLNLVGPYNLTPAAIKWGKEWYLEHNNNPPEHLNDDRFGGYLARKQTHVHKLAIVISAAQRDTQIITDGDLALANTMVSDLEADMQKVFEKIGKKEETVHVERLITHLKRIGPVSYAEAYRYCHMHFPDAKEFESILNGAIRAGYLKLDAMTLKVSACAV